jgi:hypothetical protein
MSTFLLALSIPGLDPDVDDPEEIADRIALTLTDHPVHGGTDKPGEVMVSAIPAAQWLTPQTLANLRANAADRPASMTKCPLAIDLCEFIDDQPLDMREFIAHIVTCRSCHRGVVNIIQSSPGYPDLFGTDADPETTP